MVGANSGKNKAFDWARSEELYQHFPMVSTKWRYFGYPMVQSTEPDGMHFRSDDDNDQVNVAAEPADFRLFK